MNYQLSSINWNPKTISVPQFFIFSLLFSLSRKDSNTIEVPWYASPKMLPSLAQCKFFSQLRLLINFSLLLCIPESENQYAFGSVQETSPLNLLSGEYESQNSFSMRALKGFFYLFETHFISSLILFQIRSVLSVFFIEF